MICGFFPFWKQYEVTNFRKTVFLDLLHFEQVSLQGKCKIEIKIKNRITIDGKLLEFCLVLFFVKNVNFDQFLKNHKFQKFAYFRIKIVPNEDSLGLILKKTLIFHGKRIRLTLFLLTNSQNCSKI